MRRFLLRPALAGLSCAGLLLAATGTAVAAPTLACGDVLYSDTVLTHDITCVAADGFADGLVLGAPGITLDLAGHHVTGAGIGVSAGGIRVPPGVDGTTIRNGHISGFTEGVVVDSSAWTLVTGMAVHDVERGINLANASWSTVVMNTIGHTDLDGIRVDGWGSVGNQVTRNDVSDSGFIGLTVSNGARGTEVSRNVVDGGEFGIAVFAWADDTKVMRNEVSGTWAFGISAHYGATHTRIQRNAVVAGTGVGIQVGSDGPITSWTRVDWNSVTGYGAGMAIVEHPTGEQGTVLFRNIVG
jgi:nitrous oxidase accessory protein NosD